MGIPEDQSGASLKCGKTSCVCCLWIHETSYIEEEGIKIDCGTNGLSKNLINVRDMIKILESTVILQVLTISIMIVQMIRLNWFQIKVIIIKTMWA